MNIADLQYAVGTVADGIWGPNSNAALMAAFINKQAPAITADEIVALAKRLDCTPKQLGAVAKVESSSSGFDINGRPKMLFERHLFHRATGGKWSPSIYSDPKSGGYDQNSWGKLCSACARDVDAAFGSASWGKFQVLGLHWKALGYASPFELAKSTTQSEAAHYEMFARYIEATHLKDELAAISADPETCRGFARGYNGPNYARGDYHHKIAWEMSR